ncbi:GSCOCT00013859001.3-RA-CDS, partial [Cotesia congregata]
MELINLKLKNKFFCDRCRSGYNRYFIFVQHIFYKIIGLSPWSLDMSNIILKTPPNDNDQIIVCKLSYLGSCYNLLLFLFISSTNFYVLFNLTFPNFLYDSILTPTVRAKLKFVAVLCITFIPLIYICRQKLMISVINRLKNVDIKLQNCRSYKARRRNCYTYFIFIMNFLIFISYIVLVFYYFSKSSVIVQLIILFPDFISSWMIIQFTILLRKIYKRFKSINSAISKLDIRSKLNASEKNGSLLTELAIFEIRTIKFAFIELCEICQDSADFYGLPILISIIHYVLISIIRLYFVILALLQIKESNNMLYVCAVVVNGSIIFLLVVLTSTVTKTTKESNKTGKVINLLMDQCSMDQKIEQRLAKFSSDILHLKIEFTAYDVIPLDRRLLAMIVGTVATYLVIVIQF